MKKFEAFPKIGQFRNAVKDVKGYCKHNEISEPVLKFEGTVKLHGTNAGIGMITKTGEIFAQSRSRIITVDNDNAGFAKEVHGENHISYRALLTQLGILIPDAEYVYVFGEWCGGNIQKGVALTQLKKMFVVFNTLAVYEDGKHAWTNAEILDNEYRDKYNEFGIYFASQFPTYSVEIDFNNPGKFQNELIEITDKVEQECPVGKSFGVQGVGEGVVWAHYFSDGSMLNFKVKGEKHSSSKVKTLASVDPEVIENIDKFVEYACTENRLNQGLEHVNLDIKEIGKFIGWVNSDINAEEADVLASNNLTMKQVGRPIGQKAREFFLGKLQESI